MGEKKEEKKIEKKKKKEERVVVGAESLVASNYAILKKYTKIGIIADPTTVLPLTLTHLIDQMVLIDKAFDSKNIVVFAPEHGFRGDNQAGQSDQGSYIDEKTNVLVYNTYGLNTNTLQHLIQTSGVECLVFDIQDVGSRFYTFIWTKYDMMEAFTAVQMKNEPEYLTVRPFIILDRPNPLNGTLVKGPMLNPTYSSFVGRVNIPLQHGMTIGELGSIFANHYINNNNNKNNDNYLRKKRQTTC